jgi:hypothetical protein
VGNEVLKVNKCRRGFEKRCIPGYDAQRWARGEACSRHWLRVCTVGGNRCQGGRWLRLLEGGCLRRASRLR